jgi:hypothetical protein
LWLILGAGDIRHLVFAGLLRQFARYLAMRCCLLDVFLRAILVFRDHCFSMRLQARA